VSNFTHYQTAHCENGVTVGLLRQHGLDFMTEPLAFGIGSGLFYIDIPFLQINGGPAISFRTMPGSIFKRTCKALDVKVIRKKFRNQDEAMNFLDMRLEEGLDVGCQVGVFHLPYFPKEYRFHFNAHNLIVFDKIDNDYLVSDPVMEHTTRMTYEELKKVRFAKGSLAPRGQIYYPLGINTISDEQLRTAIVRGIKRNCKDMLTIPASMIGVKGIVHTSKKVRKWREKLGVRRAALNLGQIVRMQEEIGTGGGGFRFLYAAFLEEAAVILQKDDLLSVSEQFTKAGDLWRDSAFQMSGIFKGRLTEQKDFEACADLMVEISEVEKKAFQELSKIKF
jgi:hypothetical protein